MNARTCPPCYGNCTQGRTCPARTTWRLQSERVAQLPATRTGLRIGIAHQPPLAAIDGDARALQSALLEPRTADRVPLWSQIAAAVWRWL